MTKLFGFGLVITQNMKKCYENVNRIFECDACGFVIDRDLNAAINLNNYAA